MSLHNDAHKRPPRRVPALLGCNHPRAYQEDANLLHVEPPPERPSGTVRDPLEVAARGGLRARQSGWRRVR